MIRPSLFWTLAGSFLAVLIAATLLQGIIIFVVVEPMTQRGATRQADTRAREAAWEIAATPDPTEAEIATILQAAGPGEADEPRHVFLVYRATDGWLVTGRPVPRPARSEVARLLDGEIEAIEPFRGPPGRGYPLPPEAEGDRPGSRGRPGRFGRLEVAARHAVETENGVLGEVAALIPARPRGIWPRSTPRPILLFLPLAVALASAGGLVLFRLLVRRLHALETLATRVTEGDLDARVDDTGRDEIGRLASRLNGMTESLATAKQRIEDNERTRRQLLADISHELATPLTSIRGFAETMLEPRVPVSDEERTAYLENVVEESKRMDALIRDLFELTRLEADAVSLDREPLDWGALCRNTLTRFEGRFRDAGLELEWAGSSEAVPILGDGRRLEQVVDNLLINALRYVPRGGRVTVSAETNDQGFARLIVTDDGPGFPPEDLGHVFERFYRADPARADGGSGLGLAIVQEIALRHGGAVRAENRPGGGARLIVELPIEGSKAGSA